MKIVPASDSSFWWFSETGMSLDNHERVMSLAGSVIGIVVLGKLAQRNFRDSAQDVLNASTASPSKRRNLLGLTRYHCECPSEPQGS